MSGILQALLAGFGAATDEYFKYVTMLLPGNGTNGAQNNTFLDSSTNNFTITRNGNTTQGTFSPYGNLWSNYFDGSGDYLSVADNAALDLSTGDFTIECWVFPVTGISDVDGLISKRNQSTFSGGDWRIAYRSASTAFGIATGSNNTDRLTPAITLNAWNHVAFVRSSGTLSCYANGTRGDTLTWTENLDNTEALLIGLNVPGFDLPGYISNVRIVKGTAVYSGSTYTVPTSPLTAITNTSLLTCQSNRFRDASTNAFTITRNGDVSVQRFSPFNPTAPYAAGTDGGSGYFDGSGDYIQAADSASLSFSGDFTCEGWFYYTGTAASLVPSILIDSGTSAVSAFEINNGSTYLQLAGQVTNNTISRTTFSGTVVPGAWTHIAYVRSSNVISVYVNGVVSATTLSNSVATGRIRQVGDGRTSGLPFPGYISNFRLVGSAVYTSNFTPPASPVTAITNTQLLCDFTNAGIIDNAEMNNLETVGNAQISTAQSKFGGGSMAFDGSGDYLVSNPATTNLYAFGTGDFTIEFWINPTTTSGGIQIIYEGRPLSTNGAYPTIYLSGTTLVYYANDGERISGGTISTGVFSHIAVSRSGTSTRMFLNGTQVGSTYTDSTNYLGAAGAPRIWVGAFTSTTIAGYIDDLRITKGYARYTANFTPPSAPFPLQ